ncbi:hypothetical protein BU24DRAFT_168412 [Aaosphaeria arxii CBS 175.79]|uniref:Zn(2)-C6 fungal-type domain-containing protein n=1 Tax=Aaosphaeria arxii CBS 175.79 TaxID=1450172 RepID=A0A6A5XZ95_9PLEO|nr:uncharacterized protein BU24DRAFT_168412 [Aaosphaeria arxii CBS 175.79]KAF2018316.1 hypothetical protein BU24DRAFT_168412 [Aaosphaeria arxii CBS 175.79]
MPSPERVTAQRPAPLACLECRRTHLKCDAATPICGRCNSRGLPCSYTSSKRGTRRGTKRANPDADQLDTSRKSPCFISEPTHWITDVGEFGLNASIDAQTSSGIHVRHAQDTPPALPVARDAASIRRDAGPQQHRVDDEQLVNLYYLNFHNSHPILLPGCFYWERRYPRYLKAVVEFIGSHFSSATPSATLRDATARELAQGDQNTTEMVQARILYTILLFARNEVDEGQQMLDAAVKMAVSLGLHRRDFAASHSKGDAREEESLRRTWYELYITDACVAALQRKSTFPTHTIIADVLLPCEDSLYSSEVFLYTAPSLSTFESSIFSDHETTFSSSAYRIQAAHLLGRVVTMTSNPDSDGDSNAHTPIIHRDRIQSLDNALAAFLHHLPASKTEPEIVNAYGSEPDELIFSAHALLQHATILLHFPRGNLSSSVPPTTHLPGGHSARSVCPCTRQHVHSVKAVDASRTIAMLAALRCPVQRHSPFFVYPLALSAVVQLSAGMMHLRAGRGCLAQHYERVKLIHGVLRSLGRYWDVAGVVLRALNRTATAVFQPLFGSGEGEVGDGGYAAAAVVDAAAVSSETMAGSVQWLEGLDGLDLSGMMGLDADCFCL